MPLFKSVRCTIALCCLAGCSAAVPESLYAQAPRSNRAEAAAGFETIDLEESSLRFADAETAFYGGSYQLGPQWQAFLDGPVVTNLRETDVARRFQEAFDQAWDDREGPVGQVRGVLENPNVVSLIDVLRDTFDEEVFVLGGGQWPESIVGATQLVREFQTVAASGNEEAAFEYFMSLEPDEIENIRIPTTVFGGQITDRDAALLKVDELNGILQFGLSQIPQGMEVLSGLERTEDDRGVRIQLTLSESMIPWEQIPTNGEVQVEDAIDHARELIAGRQITITIGLLDEFLIFALSETPEDINSLGSEGGSLLETEEMELVREHADEPVLGINYQSDAMVDANFQANFAGYFGNNSRQLLAVAQNEIERELEETEDEEEIAKLEARQEILDSLPEDMQWLDEQIGQHLPEFRGATSVAVATEDGIESWTHSRTESVLLEAEGELPVLGHLGESPIMVLAGRKAYHPEYFQTVRDIAGKVHEYLERLAESEALDDDEAEDLSVFLERGWPLLQRLGDIVQDEILPATEDGQYAFVLNPGEVTVTQFGDNMPPPDQPLPVPALAKVVGLSDRDQLIGGFEKLFDLADETVTVVRELEPGEIPDGYSVPRPLSKEVEGGKMFFYEIPKKQGLPEGITPAAIFTEKFAYWGYSEPQLESLLEERQFEVPGGLLEDMENVASVCYFNGGRLFEQLRPWVGYAIGLSDEETLVESVGNLPEITRDDVLAAYDALLQTGEWVIVKRDLGEQGTLSHLRYFQADAAQ